MQHAAREKTLAGELGSVEICEYCIEIVAQKEQCSLLLTMPLSYANDDSDEMKLQG